MKYDLVLSVTAEAVGRTVSELFEKEVLLGPDRFDNLIRLVTATFGLLRKVAQWRWRELSVRLVRTLPEDRHVFQAPVLSGPGLDHVTDRLIAAVMAALPGLLAEAEGRKDA